MKKTRSTIYFQKRYCLLVHSLILNQKISVLTFSTNSSEREIIDRSCTFNINQIVYINCIDVIQNGITLPDITPTLYFSSVAEKMAKKLDIASVKFDMGQQKIMKPESSVLFSKELSDGKGVIQYKFINLKTKTLTPEEFQKNRSQRSELQLEHNRDENNVRIQELMRILHEKDEMIKKLQNKIEHLILQNRRKIQQKPEGRQNSKDKTISFNVKVNTVNDGIRRQNEKLLVELQQHIERIEQLDRQNQNYAKQKEALEKEVNMLKKQNQKLQTESQIKHNKGRSVSYIQPSFLRNSSVNQDALNNSNSDWAQNSPNPTKITVNEPNNNKKTSILRRDRQSSIKSGSPQGTYPRRQSNMISSAFVTSAVNEVGLKTSGYQQKDHPNNQSEQMGSNSRIEELQGREQVALNRRISLQQEDLKLNSIIFEKKEEIDILKLKLQAKTNEVKNIEKELQKAKILLKKKQIEIKQLKKQSRKNLTLGDGSSKDLVKNRAEFQQQLDKILLQNDKQKVSLQQQIQRLQKASQAQDKQFKKVKQQLLQKNERLKNAQIKYNEIKKYTVSKESQFIEYRQKSQQYDLMNIKYKEIEGILKSTNAKYQIIEKENQKLSSISTNSNSKIKELIRQLERLKKAERQFQLAKNQNINYLRSIDDYEHRYNQLKKYCIRIEASYNKYVTSKRSKGSQGKIQQSKEERQIQQKFIDVNKKMSECQIYYIKQQIQDLNQNKNFISVYLEKKLREERENIQNNKELSEQEKRSMLIEKEREYERNMSDKLTQFKTKISKLQKSLEEINNQLRDSKDGIGLSEKLRLIEKKISMINENQQSRTLQRRNMKQTLQHLGDQLKRASSSSYLNKNASKNQLLLSMINQNKQKASLLEEARERNVASQQRTMEQNRKLNTQLIKQNGQLKLKNQKLTIQFDKIERKGQEREKQLQQIFKKSEVQFKLSNDRLLEANQKLKAEIENIKTHFSDSQAAVAKISEQAALLSHEIQDKQLQVQQLQQKIAALEDRIEEYEKSEKMMRQQVNELKSHAEQNQLDLVALIQARSDNFAKIQKMKQVEIEKLKAIIYELEVKLQAEMFESMKLKDKNEEILTNLEKLEKETQQKLQIQKLAIQSKQATIDEIYMKEVYAKKQNEILQQNLLEISTQIENKQMEIAQMAYQLTKLKKQAQVYKNESSSFEKLQQKYKDDIKGLQTILKQKLEQIRGFQDKYRELQLRFDYSGKQMQRLALSSLKYETDAKQFQQKYMNKHEQVMNAKNQCSLLQYELHKQQDDHEKLAKQNQLLKEHIHNLQKEIQRLTQLSNSNQNNNLRVSRKISSEIENKNDTSSIGKSRRIAARRSGTLEVPQVSAIGGNITPINPVSPTPLIRKLSQNPFQPREDPKQFKLKRGSSIEEVYDGDIAIHIQSPTDSPRYPNSKNASNIQIDIPDIEDSIRITNNNNNNPKPSSKQLNELTPQIRQQTEENQENSGAFGRNIDLQNSDEIADTHNRQYEQHIYQLKQELLQSNEQNEELSSRVEELSRKIEEMMAEMAKNQNQNQKQPNKLGINLSLSRRTPMELPIPNNQRDGEIRQSKKGSDIPRSSSGLQLNSSRERQGIAATNNGNYGQLQQQYQSAQLQIQYLTNQLNAARSQLQEHETNNERLIEQAELCRQKIEELNNMVQQAHFQIAQAEKFMQFQKLYKDQIQITNELKLKIQELNVEIFSKQDHIATLIKEHGQLEQQLALIKRQTVQTGDNQSKLQNQIKKLEQTISKLKIQYRKYQQSAQLQILHLKDSYDALKQKLEQKEQQVIQLGEEYLQLQSNKDQIASIIQQKDKIIKKNEYNNNQLSTRCNELEDQLGKTDDNRQNLYRTIKQLEQQIDKKDQNLKKLTNQTALVIKKYQIKLQSNQKQIEIVQQKLVEKQKVISSLKSQIGLYNEECQQLKVLNDELTYQSTKIQKQLRDIMMTYSSEIDSYRETIEKKEQQIVRLGGFVHEKESQYHNLLKNLRNIQKQKDFLNSDYIDVKNTLQKTKNAKVKENNQIYVQLQYKNSECEKLKATINIINKQIESKNESSKLQIQKYENRLLSYKQKLERYEKMTQQFQQQLKKVQQRPTIQAYEQVIFQNEIYRNRVQQLEDQLHSKGDSRIKQQLIYSQFRKYKANKERQSQDLQAQMQKYGLKINELEQSNYFLKKENETLKIQIQNLRESNDEINNQYQDMKESMEELQKELHFYKKRKLFDMQKLLNDTQ